MKKIVIELETLPLPPQSTVPPIFSPKPKFDRFFLSLPLLELFNEVNCKYHSNYIIFKKVSK